MQKKMKSRAINQPHKNYFKSVFVSVAFPQFPYQNQLGLRFEMIFLLMSIIKD